MSDTGIHSFNTQPPEGGWDIMFAFHGRDGVSTHSRLKAAGGNSLQVSLQIAVSTHSRLKAAGTDSLQPFGTVECFNTQPPEGGWADTRDDQTYREVSTHSRLKAAGPARLAERKP